MYVGENDTPAASGHTATIDQSVDAATGRAAGRVRHPRGSRPAPRSVRMGRRSILRRDTRRDDLRRLLRLEDRHDHGHRRRAGQQLGSGGDPFTDAGLGRHARRRAGGDRRAVVPARQHARDPANRLPVSRSRSTPEQLASSTSPGPMGRQAPTDAARPPLDRPGGDTGSGRATSAPSPPPRTPVSRSTSTARSGSCISSCKPRLRKPVEDPSRELERQPGSRRPERVAGGRPGRQRLVHRAQSDRRLRRLVAVGKNFYGIFCGNNTPDNANFPSGVTYQRNRQLRHPQLLTDLREQSGRGVDRPVLRQGHDRGGGGRLLRPRLDRQRGQRRQRCGAVHPSRLLRQRRRLEPPRHAARDLRQRPAGERGRGQRRGQRRRQLGLRPHPPQGRRPWERRT